MRGSIVKRGKTWSYVLYLGRDASGKKQQKWAGGHRTKREAEDALTAALERRRTGTWGDPGRQTVAEFLEHWLAAVRPSLRETTAASYDTILSSWVIPRIGNQRLAVLDAARISALYSELLTSGRSHGTGGLSPRSVRYAHAILTHALGDAVKWGLLPRNPAALVSPPRQARKEMAVWSADQVNGFLTYVRDDRLAALWTVLITTGMRRGEALGLRWSDLDASTISVRRERVVTDGWHVVESEPKTAKGRRVIPLDPGTVAVLAAHRKAQVAEQLAAGELWEGEGWIFCDERGRPLHPQSVSKRFGVLAEEAGLPRLPLHGLRHTSATMALLAGIHPKIVQGRLGHSTVAMTLDIYTDAVQSVEEEAAAKMGALIHPASPGPAEH